MAETDRELLELAARAAGLNPHEAMWHSRAGFVWVRRVDGIRTENAWNPLADDGDALRLAVKLRLNVHIEDYGTAARKHDYMPWHCCETHLHGGIEAATRRAITRAAAELARAADAGGKESSE